MIFATVDDLIARYGVVNEEDMPRAELLLADAAVIIIRAGGSENPEGTLTDAYRVVSCAMVHRVLISPAWASLGATQHNNTAGPFTESYSFQNPNGDLYLTRAEKKTLGLGGVRIGTIPPMTHKDRSVESEGGAA
ncbi:MAG: phage Gp19/Gp15/Gp42 family protein [Clostridiales bacterium]|nr:phage Gp19/Gp15/Gp42 family protein [Clostridiales bacterium]